MTASLGDYEQSTGSIITSPCREVLACRERVIATGSTVGLLQGAQEPSSDGASVLVMNERSPNHRVGHLLACPGDTGCEPEPHNLLPQGRSAPGRP